LRTSMAALVDLRVCRAGRSSIALTDTSTSRGSPGIDPSAAIVPCELYQVKHNRGHPNASARLRQHADLVWSTFLFMALLMAL